jgi:hypothetical protein
MQNRAALLFAAVLLGSCSAEGRYAGDGQLIDHGPGAANERYVLDLGTLDLANVQQMQLRMSSLPATEFVAGVQVEPVEPLARLPEDFGAAVVSMRLADADGATVISISKPLREWTRSESVDRPEYFFYVRDDSPTRFTPVKGQSYSLTVTVSPAPVAEAPVQTRILLKSGGWK